MEKTLLQKMRMASSKVVHAQLHRGQIIACDEPEAILHLANAAVYSETSGIDSTARDYIGFYPPSAVYVITSKTKFETLADMEAVSIGDKLNYSRVKFHQHKDNSLDLNTCPLGSAVFITQGRLKNDPSTWSDIARKRDLTLAVQSDSYLNEHIDFDHSFLWDPDTNGCGWLFRKASLEAAI